MYFCLLLQYLVIPCKDSSSHYLESKHRNGTDFLISLHFQHEASSDCLKCTRKLTKSIEQCQIIYNYLWFHQYVNIKKKSKGKWKFSKYSDKLALFNSFRGTYFFFWLPNSEVFFLPDPEFGRTCQRICWYCLKC